MGSDTTEQPAHTHTHTHTQDPVLSRPISTPLMCQYLIAIFPEGLRESFCQWHTPGVALSPVISIHFPLMMEYRKLKSTLRSLAIRVYTGPEIKPGPWGVSRSLGTSRKAFAFGYRWLSFLIWFLIFSWGNGLAWRSLLSSLKPLGRSHYLSAAEKKLTSVCLLISVWEKNHHMLKLLLVGFSVTCSPTCHFLILC